MKVKESELKSIIRECVIRVINESNSKFKKGRKGAKPDPHSLDNILNPDL